MNSITLDTADSLSLEAVEHTPTRETPSGSVLLAHGITQDLTESNDVFVSLTEQLVDSGYSVVRFSYRGHGNSDGAEEGVTIAGECLDFKTVIEHLQTYHEPPYFVLAASFGAVSTCLSLPYIEEDVSGIVLWNPVLDLEATFIDPYLPWGIENFTGENLQHLLENDYLLIDESFRMGRVLYEEMKHYEPHEYFTRSSVPSIVLHGDQDDLVPLDVSTEVSDRKPNCEFERITDSAHGFKQADGSRTTEDIHREIITITTEWITAHT